MKYLFTSILLISFCSILNAQVITFQEVSEATKRIKGKFTEYHCENGEIFKIGDMITLGMPLNGSNAFVKVVESNGFSTPTFPTTQSSGFKSEIKKLVVGGSKRNGYEVIAVGKTSIGLTSYYISIEAAMNNGEIETSIMTRAQAIAKLKESKDLLDLDMITQKEYDVLKEKLTPIIRND
jgi:hypothetical protein